MSTKSSRRGAHPALRWIDSEATRALLCCLSGLVSHSPFLSSLPAPLQNASRRSLHARSNSRASLNTQPSNASTLSAAGQTASDSSLGPGHTATAGQWSGPGGGAGALMAGRHAQLLQVQGDSISFASTLSRASSLRREGSLAVAKRTVQVRVWRGDTTDALLTGVGRGVEGEAACALFTSVGHHFNP